MNRFLLYSIFFILATGVIFSLFFAYKYIKPAKDNNLTNFNKLIDDVGISSTELESSWLKDITRKRSKASYFYSTTQIEIKLN